MSELKKMIENVYKLYLELSKKEDKLKKVREALVKLGVNTDNVESYFDVSENEAFAIINKIDFPEEFEDVVEMVDEIVYWGYGDFENTREVSDWRIIVTTAKYRSYDVQETYANLGELVPLVTAEKNGDYEERYYYLGSVGDVNVYLVVEIHWLTN